MEPPIMDDRESQEATVVSLLDSAGQVRSFEDIEKEIYTKAFERLGGVVTRVAEQLQVGRATVYRKAVRFGIALPPMSERAIDYSKRRK